MKIPLDERIERLTKWFHRQNDRPLLGFSLGSQYPLHRFPGCRKNLPQGPALPEHVVVEDYLDDADRMHEAYEECGGDLIWAASPFVGIPWVEASLGCGVIADHETGSSRSEPPPGFADNVVVPQFDPDNPWVRKMVSFIPALVERSAGRYPVAGTLMRGVSDLLSALYGGEEFLFRMLESPEEVKAVCLALTEYWIEFGRHLYGQVPTFRGGTGAFYYAVWCPGQTVWLQEDAAALLSPDLYEQYIYPCDCRIAEAFEHTVMHMHPAKFIPVDWLVKSPISVLELHMDQGGPTAEDLFETHKKILVDKPLIVWGDCSDADVDWIMRKLPHQGLCVNVSVDSPAKARALWERYVG